MPPKRRSSPKVIFAPFTAADFREFMKHSVAGYAREITKARGLSVREGLRRSRDDFQRLLPQGHLTPEHSLYRVETPEGRRVGSVWVNCTGRGRHRQAYLYDIRISPKVQGQGYGRATMKQLERWTKQNGGHQLGLNVFGHNKRARALYESCGYEVRSLNMVKRLTR